MSTQNACDWFKNCHDNVAKELAEVKLQIFSSQKRWQNFTFAQ